MARMTVRTAAQALGVSPHVLEEYLERTGKMEAIRQGKRVFIPSHEVKALLKEKKRQAQPSHASPSKDTASQQSPVQENTVSVPASHYEALLEELGRLRYQSQLLEFYRTEAYEKNALLLEKEHRLGQLEAELAQLKKPWWSRLWRR